MEEHPFKVEQEGFIAWLVLNRPEKRNSMNIRFFEGLQQHLEEFDRNEEIRAVIIRAEGKSFTAGTDLFELGPLVQSGDAHSREELKINIRRLQEAIGAVERCRKPVIAAAHGHCIGGGVDLLSACDIRIAARDTIFAIRETKVAVIADLGTFQRLPHIIGHGIFRELALTGRDFTAEEAMNMGFITHICETREELYAQARRTASEIAACSPISVQGAKEVILYSRDHGIQAGLEYVAQKNAAALLSEDLVEAVKSFMEKRAPVFRGR
ncbi:MAG: enoyl-CoA hydratase [Deltaproteobacteria bacterium HGW-Deltaproteobacteria-21]|nr:MAG: enoyl-CoA hydratase [Deltaproteobacteria bacterium HGW-Deltaproteobacteria-21]